MTLEFNPPSWLIQDYMNRPRPIDQLAKTVGDISNQYIERKKQEQAAQSGATKSVIDLIGQDPELLKTPLGQKLLKQSGADLSGYQPPSLSSATAPSPQTTPMDAQNNPIGGPMQGPQNAPAQGPQMPGVTPTTPASGMGAPSPIIDHWNQTIGQQAPGGSSPNVNSLMGRGKLGQKAMGEYKTGLETQKLQNELNKPEKGPLQTITKEQALKNGSFDPTKQLMVEPPAPRLDLSTKQDQFDQKEWDKIVKDTNPLTASSRSTLGMASKANFQADRALVTLSKPVVTNQEAGNAMADIAAIYQTGSPTQYGMSHQEYSTLYGKIQGALQTVTGEPKDALPDAIKKRLVGVLHDMKGTNSQVLKQQLDFTEKSKAKIIQKFPQEWKDIRSTLEDNPDMPGQNIPVISDDSGFARLPSGSQFKDPSGQLHTKK